MLCAKCGFISFDHLTVCAKCQNDLSLASAELRGTAMGGQEVFFLGSLLAAEGGRSEEGEVAAALVGEAEISIEPVEEGGETLEVGDESISLDLDLAPPPAAEVPGREIAGPEEPEGVPAPEAEPARSEEAPVLPDLEGLGLGEVAPAAPDEPLPSAATEIATEEALAPAAEASDLPTSGLEIDVASLTLEGLEEDESVALEPQALAAESEAPELAIDLNAIASDMSELMAARGDEEEQGAAGAALEFDDTMDLSLFAETSETAAPAEPAGDDLHPIDLTLGDDSLRNLTVESTAKEQEAKPKPKAEPAIQGLTMEE